MSSPIGAVQKKSNGIFTGWRRIHDLSLPLGKSVNDGIPKNFGTLKYPTIDDAVDPDMDVPAQKLETQLGPLVSIRIEPRF
jgi:hypothetical protein